ncbi:hypothetical protein CQ13_09575 [Bradyrhizobium retamae]|uniref:Uncharacterized protein n=1 Tax=Bradyrhizobium retamae TaxID=1300035 RepID=A0A0R3MFD4_9BRAD|nr:hypothetical protein CQ13_09575 [Bradyrhizobium retamae]
MVGQDAPFSTMIPIRPRKSRSPTIVARERMKRARETVITPRLAVAEVVGVAAVVVAGVLRQRMALAAAVPAALAAARDQHQAMVVVKTINGGEAAGPDQWSCCASSSL